jgi:uncharacterized protein YcbK (DUF882 family)
MEYFKLEEFDCRCCGTNKMNPDFLDKLQEAQRLAQTKFIIKSGYRCAKFNKEGGSDSLCHTKGIAADIDFHRGSQRLDILSALIRAGFERFAIGQNFIHVDSNDGPPSLWIY